MYCSHCGGSLLGSGLPGCYYHRFEAERMRRRVTPESLDRENADLKRRLKEVEEKLAAVSPEKSDG